MQQFISLVDRLVSLTRFVKSFAWYHFLCFDKIQKKSIVCNRVSFSCSLHTKWMRMSFDIEIFTNYRLLRPANCVTVSNFHPIKSRHQNCTTDHFKVKLSSCNKLKSNEKLEQLNVGMQNIFIIIHCSPTHLNADHSFAAAKWLFYQNHRCWRWRRNINESGLVCFTLPFPSPVPSHSHLTLRTPLHVALFYESCDTCCYCFTRRKKSLFTFFYYIIRSQILRWISYQANWVIRALRCDESGPKIEVKR